MMVNLISLLVLNILLIDFIVAEFPSYIQICGRRNPNLDECIVNSTEVLRSKLIAGIPELNTPSIDPLLLKTPLSLTNLNGVKAIISNVKVYNASNFQIQNFHMDLDNQQFDVQFHFNNIKLQGDYNISVRIILQIDRQGEIELDAEDVDVQANLRFVLRNTKKGRQLYFTTMTTKIKIKNYQSHTKSRHQEFDTKILDDSIDMVLTSNSHEIIDSVIPSFERSFSTAILEIANRITAKVTYDQLFPDHE